MRRAAVLLAVLAMTFLPRTGRSGNDHTFPIGGRAAGMAGAYTAMAEEASVAWYNPAGLGFNERYSLDVSASAFFLQLVRIPELVRTKLPSGDHVDPFPVTSFQVVPTSLTYAYRFGRPDASATIAHSFALSVFVPQSQKFSKTLTLNSDEEEPRSGAPFQYHQKMHLQAENTLYYLGPSWGMRIGRSLAVGAAMYVTYSVQTLRTGFNLDIASGSGQNYFFVNTGEISVTELGVVPVLGVQVRLAQERLRLGLSVRPIGVRFLRASQGSWLEAQALPADQNNVYDEPTISKTEWGLHRSSPFRATIGAAWVTPGAWTVSADVDLVAPYRDADSGIDDRFYANGRVGCEFLLGPRYALSAGVFSDVAPERGVSGFAESRIHFFGGTVAFSFLSPYEVTGSEKTDRITFSTTLGLKYAFGFGDVMGLELDPLAASGTVAELVRKRIRVHDISAIVGSSLIF